MEKSKEKILDKLADSNWTPIGILIGIFLLWIATGLIIYYHYFINNPGYAGQFGDMFGVVNSLFSGLAFGGLIYTIILQRKELDLTRQELTLTRGEFVKQNDTLSQQRFENTFFNLLQMNIDNVNSIQFKGETGRRTFLQFYNLVRSRWNNIAVLKKGTPLTFHETVKSYIEVYQEVESFYGYHFKNLYHIMRLIDDAEDSIDKMKYARLVRAQLSTYELVLLFYNCLSSNGVEKFKPLIEKYKLLKHIDVKLLLAPADKFGYVKSAFNE